MSAPDPAPAAPMQFLENRTCDKINLGDHAELTRTLTLQDIALFAMMSGDVSPAHVDVDNAKDDMVHGMWGGALISAVLGTELPGPGTICLNQSLSFKASVALGNTVVVRVEVRARHDHDRLTLTCTCTCTCTCTSQH